MTDSEIRPRPGAGCRVIEAIPLHHVHFTLGDFFKEPIPIGIIPTDPAIFRFDPSPVASRLADRLLEPRIGNARKSVTVLVFQYRGIVWLQSHMYIESSPVKGPQGGR